MSTMAEAFRVEQLTGPLSYHGEGPMWDPATKTCYWLDMLAGDVLALSGESQVKRIHVGEVAAAIRPRNAGGFVVAVERGFRVLDESWSPVRPLAEIWSDPSIRMNEGGCDPQGRFYSGSMAYDKAPGRGALYRFDRDGSVTVVLEDITISNGIAWRAGGDQVCYVDTATQRVDIFDFEPRQGTFTDRRPLVEIPLAQGAPDGIAMDADDGLWVALWDGGAVQRYTPDGRLDAVVKLPVPRVTACCFGGQDSDQLFVTTSRVGIPDTEHPSAGALFMCQPGVRGGALQSYAG